MSTTALIQVVDGDRIIQLVGKHGDGYPDFMAPMLLHALDTDEIPATGTSLERLRAACVDAYDGKLTADKVDLYPLREDDGWWDYRYAVDFVAGKAYELTRGGRRAEL